jgi:hypothetical protein
MLGVDLDGSRRIRPDLGAVCAAQDGSRGWGVSAIARRLPPPACMVDNCLIQHRLLSVDEAHTGRASPTVVVLMTRRMKWPI